MNPVLVAQYYTFLLLSILSERFLQDRAIKVPKIDPDPASKFEHRFYTISKTFNSWFQKQLNLKKGEGVPKIQLGLVIIGKNFNLQETQRITLRFYMCINLLFQLINFVMLDDNKVRVMQTYSLKLEELKSEVLLDKPWLGLEKEQKGKKGSQKKLSVSTSIP